MWFEQKKIIFVSLVAFGMCFPAGLSHLFLPSISVSSEYDYSRVMVPVVSLQTIIMLGYVLFSNGSFRLLQGAGGYFIVMAACSLVAGLLSLNPSGYYSYSLLWLFCSLAVVKFVQNSRPGSVDVFEIMALLALIFLPAYLLDFLASYLATGLDGFASFMFASNGHSFVSFFFFLSLVLMRIRKDVVFDVPIYLQYSAMALYFLGGVASQGRVALLACFVTWALFIGRRSLLYGFIILPVFVAVGLESNKFRTTFFALMDLDFDDRVAWSSMFSRLEFWEVFFNVFDANPIAGAGGLAVNIAKFDYGFGFDVFIDPHNEFVYLLSGFGISGVLLVGSFVLFVRKQVGVARALCIDRSARLRSYAFLLYIFLCSATNANSAKQNIQLLIVVVLALLFGNLSVAKTLHKKFRRS